MNRRKFTIALGTATAGLVAGSALFGQDADKPKKKKAQARLRRKERLQGTGRMQDR